MAASIEDLAADTSYVDLRGSYLMCRPAQEYEDRHSALASRYAAALVVFNFLWAAYEGAIKVGAANFMPTQSTAFRGRELMKRLEGDATSLNCLAPINAHAAQCVLHIGDLSDARPKLAKFPAGSAAFAAELARLFRNHLAHGDDSPPEPDAPHGECRAVRFYALGRLLLLLMQLIASQTLIPGDPGYEDDDEDDLFDGRQRSFREVLLNLQFEACPV
jgi:hypothetical protein